MKSLLAVALWATMAQPWAYFSTSAFTKSIDSQKFETIAIDATWGDIKIRLVDSDEIQITGQLVVNGTSMNDRIEVEEKFKGDMISIELDVEIEDIEQVIYLRDEEGNYSYIKADQYNQEKGWNGYQSMNYGRHVEAEFVIDIPREKVLNLETTYGCISSDDLPQESTIHATYGDIDLKLSQFAPYANYDIASTYGHVDVAVPVDLSTKLNLRTSYGQIYSDLNIKPNLDDTMDRSCGTGEDIALILGEGSAQLDLEATYDNIYLRKL